MITKIIREVPMGVSARHVHITNEVCEALFGGELTNFKDLSQPGQFAAHQQVVLYGPETIPGDPLSRKKISGVRVLGPTRPANQVEVTATEARNLGIKNVPVRMSGDTSGTPGLLMKGPNGEVELSEGVIIAQKHLHITPAQASHWGLKDGDSIIVGSHDRTRNSIMTDVIVRVSKTAALDLHIDTEEGNALGISNGANGLILDPEEITSFLSKLPKKD